MFEQQVKGIAEWYRKLTRESKQERIADLAEESGLSIAPQRLHYILSEIHICENLYQKSLQYSSGYEDVDILQYFRSSEQFQEFEQQIGLPLESIIAALYSATLQVPTGERHWTMEEILSADISMRRLLRSKLRAALRKGNLIGVRKFLGEK